MFASKIRDIDFNILLQTDINHIEQLCKTFNKQIYNVCHDTHFWHLKFKNDGLPLPDIDMNTISDWIKSYNHIKNIMEYINYIILNYYDFYFHVHDIKILKDLIIYNGNH